MLNFNSKSPKKILYNGLNVAKLVFNGIVVWIEKVLTSITSIFPIVLHNSVGDDLVDYKIYGESEQKSILPDEYQQIGYIESTGTQYIQTDYIANQSTNSKGTYQIMDVSVARMLFGARTKSASSDFYGFNWGGSSPFKLVNAFYIGRTTTTEADTKKHTFEKISNVLYLDGTRINTNNEAIEEWNTTYPIAIFGCNSAGTVGLQSSSRLYDLQFFEGGKKLYHFVPCYRISDGEIGLYDIVNDVFYTNDGEGTFLKGADTISNIEPMPDLPVEIESVGERTYNLLKLKDNLTQTKNGIDIKVNDDGTIVCNGICTANIDLLIAEFDFKLNTQYHCSGSPANGSTTTYRMFFNNIGSDLGNGIIKGNNNEFLGSHIRLLIYEGYECNNLTFKPMVVLGKERVDYEPYGKYKIPVKVSGKNLLPYPYMSATQTKTGITFTDNGDGSITLNGTSTASTTFYLFQDLKGLLPGIKIGDTITISKNANDNNQQGLMYFVCNYYDETTTMKPGPLASKADTAKGVVGSDWIGSGIYINIPKGNTINNLVLKPMIEIDSQPTDYEPYVESITTNVYLDEPLRKFGEYTDYIDFANQKIFRNVGHRVFDGTEEWVIHTTTNEGRVFRNENLLTPLINASINNTYMTHFSLTEIYSTSTFTNGLYRFAYNQGDLTISSSRLYVSAEQTTVEDFKNWLTENKPSIYYPITELPEDFELPAIQTHVGTTIIEVDTNIQPSNAEIVYYKR